MDPIATGEPVVVVGASRAERIPALVCEATIHEHCPGALVIQVFDCANMPRTRRPLGTNFSLVRFWAPELCGYTGRAIYVDSDMIVFRCIRELFELEMRAPVVAPRNQTAVLLLDCARLRSWRAPAIAADIDAGRRSAVSLMTHPETAADDPTVRVARDIPSSWNVLERWEPGTSLLHYTDMAAQPWRRPGHPAARHWYDALRLAVRTGVVDVARIREDVGAGYLSRHVLAEVS